jgi:Metallo-beta-lactamase superfamily
MVPSTLGNIPVESDADTAAHISGSPLPGVESRTMGLPPRAAPGGIVRVWDQGNVKVHTYISPEDAFLTNTQIVEGKSSLIIFDGQLFLPYAKEAAMYARSLAKTVERIIVSHAHLDHWSGLPVLAEHFGEAKIYALPGVAQYLRQNGQKVLDARKSAYGDKIPVHPTIPTEILSAGRTAVDGVNCEFRQYVDAEAATQLVTLIPDQRTLLGFDLIFAPNEHVFTVTPHFNNWIRILEELNAVSGYDHILSTLAHLHLSNPMISEGYSKPQLQKPVRFQ